MTNIMDKYQSLNRGIETARRETSQFQESKDCLREQVEQLQDDRIRMEQDVETARQESTRLQSEIQETMLQSSSNTSGATAADCGGTDYQDYGDPTRRVEFSKTYAEQQRRNFCEESREFRATVKRLKLTSTECGLDDSVAHAFLQVHGRINAAILDYDDENKENVPPAAAATTAAPVSMEVLEDEWHKEAMSATAATAQNDDDTVYNQAPLLLLLSYQRAYSARQTAEHAFNDVMILRGNAAERATKRSLKMESLHTQLVRIRKTIGDLDGDLAETQEQTRELEAIAESYQQRVVQRVPAVQHHQQAQHQQNQQNQQHQQHQQHQHQHQHQHQQQAPGQQHQQQTPGQQQRRSIFPPNPYAPRQSPAAVQHPHLAGRIRMDRQFGASVGIAIGGDRMDNNDDDSDDDEIGDFVAFRRRN